MLLQRAAGMLSANVASLPGQQILFSPIDSKWLVINSCDHSVDLSMRCLGLQACIYVRDRFLEFTYKLYNSG